MPTTAIEVFAEIACPYTHVGLRRIVARRAHVGADGPRLHIRAWPLELVNDAPMDPATVAEHVDELRARVEPGLFREFDPAAVPPTSMPAFELAAMAARVSVECAEQVGLALRDALFEQGRDVSAPDVLADVRAEFDLPAPDATARRAVDRDYAEGRRRGVRGSPEYFVDGRGFGCPALRLEEHGGALAVDDDSLPFDELLDACFA